MLKRRNGYLLLTLLVLTGLAGRLHTETLNGKERRLLIHELKSSRQDLRTTIRGLSDKHLDFRTAAKQPTIRECLYELSAIENALWNTSQQALKNTPSRAMKNEMDEESLKHLVPVLVSSNKQQKKYGSSKEAINQFLDTRAHLLKFARTTTGNVRAHTIKTSIGNLDVYQLMLLNSATTRYYVEKIREIKSHRNFPRLPVNRMILP